MVRNALIAVCASTLVSACGSVQAVFNPGEVEKARLDAAGLKTQDLPRGFAEPVRTALRPPVAPKDKRCATLMDAIGGRLSSQDRTAQSAVSFEGDRLGQFGGVVLATYGGNRARSLHDELTTALDRCTDMKANSSALTTTKLDLPPRGDASRAARFTGRLNGYPYEIHLVVVRVDHTLATVTHGSLGGADQRDTDEIVRVAVAKLHSTTGSPSPK